MLFPKTEKFIFKKASETKLPSVSIAMIKDNDVVWSKGFGFRDIERGFPATDKTLYCIGSVTKSFTSVAVMQLAEQGKLSIDDPIDKYFPFNIQPMGEKVLIHHLMSHTSGIPALAYAEAMIDHATGAGGTWLPISGIDDMLTFMEDAGDWVATKPGERWFYLNEGYAILGALIEKVSGASYIDYVTNHILKPLGMNRSIFKKADFDSDSDAAVPYNITDKGERLPTTYPFGSVTADGGLISSVLDMSKYVNMYLGWGKTKDAKILEKSSVEAMQTARIKTPMENNPFGDYMYCFGLGRLPNFLGNVLVGHSGSVGSATAYTGFIPEKNMGVVVLINGSGYNPSQMGQYALAEALSSDPDQLPFARREKVLTELTGFYQTYKGTMKVQVRKAGDFLTVVMGDRYNTNTIPLIPENLEGDKRVFYTLSAGNRLTVEFKKKNGTYEVIYERYAMRKTGDLA